MILDCQNGSKCEDGAKRLQNPDIRRFLLRVSGNLCPISNYNLHIWADRYATPCIILPLFPRDQSSGWFSYSPCKHKWKRQPVLIQPANKIIDMATHDHCACMYACDMTKGLGCEWWQNVMSEEVGSRKKKYILCTLLLKEHKSGK